MEQQSTQEVCYTEREIMQEIIPILKEYFIANFRKTDGGIVMKLPDGQKFLVSITKL